VWRHICESVEGLHHRAHGESCQDSCLARVFGDGAESALVACVADGAGSSPHSGIGSELACKSIMDSSAAYFDAKASFAELNNDEVLDWCNTARLALSEHAEARERQLRDYASTLCVAIVSDKGSTFFQIGDGAIVARRHSALGVLFWPQSGEYINTTNFLTSHEFRDHVQIWSAAEGFSDVALLTDGLERLALRFDTLTPHPPFFQPFFGALRRATDVEALSRELRRFLQSESVQTKTDDDKTLVLASRIAE
jgi:hypothetical protein